MKVYQKHDIERIYTDMVQDYLKKGYVINPGTMAGSQGEIAKVDLTNLEEIVRVRINSNTDFKLGYVDVLTITVEAFGMDEPGCFGTLWDGKGREVKVVEFVQLDERHTCGIDGKYAAKEDYIKAGVAEKREERIMAADESEVRWLEKFDKKLCQSIVKKVDGLKTVKVDDIKGLVKVHGGYVIKLANRKIREIKVTADGLHISLF